MLTYDEAAATAAELAASWEDLGRNEATTRLQIIDRLLFDVLAWPREQCTSEESFGGEYTDYSLGNPARKFVIEAKREGRYFELPEGSGNRIVSLPNLLRGNDALKAAVTQAAGYCATRGIKLAAVCNGHQFVAFVGSRNDGIAPSEGRAVVFRSLDDIVDNFVDFWNLLSFEGISADNLAKRLLVETKPLPPEKMSKLLFGYPGLRMRNELDIDLDILGELFIEDVVRAQELEEAFLRACYCTSGALSQYALVSRDVLRSRYYETVNRKVQTVHDASAQGEISPDLMGAMLERGLSRRPIVLLGDVGVGKTTFIRHLVNIDAKDELASALVLYINFGSQPALRTDLEAFVADKFAEQLREEYGIDIMAGDFVRAVYNGEINRFQRGLDGDLRSTDPDEYRRRETEMLRDAVRARETHIRRTFEHLRGSERRNAVVFFDNIDQRPDEFQDQVYLIAQSMAETWRIPVFVSLRPSTFYRSKRSGSLSAYQPRVFTISPPRIDQVVLKRLRFASDLMKSDSLALRSSGITIDSATLKDYVQVLISSIEVNRELSECLDNISAGNVRTALDALNSFIGSGHVNTQKILDIYRRTGRYTIALHEFLRAIIYGDNEYYDPQSSFVPNVLDISSPSGREHFLKPIVISFLLRQSSSRSSDRGFVELARVVEFSQGLGFTADQVEGAIESLGSTGLIQTTIDTDTNRPRAQARARVTQSGAYVVERLLRTFVYVDAVVVDTPITDDSVRSSLGAPRPIEERLNRAERFLDYLDAQWTAAGWTDSGFDWPASSRAIRDQIVGIRHRLRARDQRLSQG